MSVLMQIERSKYLAMKKENELLAIEVRNLKKELTALKAKLTVDTTDKKTKKKGANE